MDKLLTNVEDSTLEEIVQLDADKKTAVRANKPDLVLDLRNRLRDAVLDLLVEIVVATSKRVIEKRKLLVKQ